MRILGSIIKKAHHSDARLIDLDEKHMDVIIFPHKKWPRMGLILGKEALVLDHKTMMAFRVRSGNLGFSSDMFIARSKYKLNKPFLHNYFLENQDNPYGIQNVMNLVHRGGDVTVATQFPPLFMPKLIGEQRRRAIEKMVGLAKKGDIVFSSHRNDAISAAIRKYDKSQFSHVAPYLGNAEVADMGPAGGQINSLYHSDDDTHFALYRIKKEIPDDVRERMVKATRELIERGVKFSFRGIFLMFLRNRFKLPVMRSKHSVSDLLFSNSFALVDYF